MVEIGCFFSTLSFLLPMLMSAEFQRGHEEGEITKRKKRKSFHPVLLH
ncbi:exported hypothetical protein [Syntrophobacter sp. SbD1]|nr:exported hypothetical protein [Syntrophobacter sp. SbD1]